MLDLIWTLCLKLDIQHWTSCKAQLDKMSKFDIGKLNMTDNKMSRGQFYKDREGHTAESRKQGVVAYTTNPFLDELTVPIGKKYNRREGGTFTTSPDRNGEVEHQIAEITQVEKVDKDQFIKLYTSEIRHFFNLKPSTQKVLMVVLTDLQTVPNKDQIYLDLKSVDRFFQEEKSMTRTTYSNAVKELIKKEFIAECALYQNQYYINPQLFFNGDRLRLVKEYVMVRNEDIKKASKELQDASDYKLEQERDG